MAEAETTIVGYLALRGFGRATAPNNQSVQPLDDATALLSALAVVWALAGVWLLAVAIRRRARLAATPNPAVSS